MKLVYVGTSRFAVPALLALQPHVCAVVTQPDRPAGRRLHFRPSPVKEAVLGWRVPVLTPESCRNPEFLRAIADLQPTALVVASYGQILPLQLLECAERGGINLHASLLPKLRGAAPIQRCLLQGESETGVTLMQMDRGMDTGDIIAQEATAIKADETASELESRLSRIAASLIEQWISRIAVGDYPRIPQDGREATYAPKVEKSEAEISFLRPAGVEYRRFRAFTEMPGAFVRTVWGRVKLLEVRPRPDPATPGEAIRTSPELVVAHSEGALSWLQVAPEGKKRMSGLEFANGYRIQPGMNLLHGKEN